MEYTLENEYLKLTVASRGAEVVSLVRKSDGVEHIWQADPTVWDYHAPVLFPHCGKVVDGTIHAKGRDFPAKQHGFAREMETVLVSQTSEKLVLALESNPETQERFPYAFRLVSTFTLEGDTLCHTLTVENNDLEEMPFGIGFHPGFTVPFDDKHTTTDYEFRFDQPESPMILDAYPNGLLTGKCGYRWKNEQSIPLTDDLFENDSFCMAGLRSRTLGIYEKDTGKGIVCNVQGYPYTLIWSAPAKPVRFVCIEPWHSLPGAQTDTQEWSQRAAAACLAPGQTWETTLSTTFER